MSIIDDIIAILFGAGMKATAGDAYDGGKPVGKIQLAGVGKGTSGREILVRTDVARDFLAMQAEAKSAGITLIPTSGFRTFAEQTALYAKNIPLGIPTARPGYSNHQDGTAIDIQTGMTIDNLKQGATTPIFRWLDANSKRFNLFRLPSEPWHYSRSGR